MKKSLFFIIFIYTAAVMVAQPRQELSPEQKQKLDEISLEAKNRFQGVWVGRAGDDSVVLYLLQTLGKIHDMLPLDSITTIYGWHQIYRHGKLVESSKEFTSNTYNEKATLYAFYKKDQQGIQLGINDLTRDRQLEASFELETSGTTAVMKTRRKWVCLVISDINIPGQTFPETITLSRISPFIDEMMLTQKRQDRDLFTLPDKWYVLPDKTQPLASLR